jgi:D-aminopeptidase
VRDWGIEIGIFRTGKFNAITDVDSVRVGHVTLIEGENVRTGVTAIVPHGGNLFQEKIPAAVIVGNGFGKLIGSTQIEELGQIETPILLTNTLSVWSVAAGVADYVLSLSGNEGVRSVNPIVGETNDGSLNDIRARRVTPGNAIEAIKRATGGVVEEGSIGAGTGTICFDWKGGIGTSSRLLPNSLGHYTVGVLVQTNFGGTLEIVGVPVGKELGKVLFQDHLKNFGDGSCMVVVATNAPLNANQLRRLARRALLGIGKTGSSMSNGSGDYVIAFSTAQEMRLHTSDQTVKPSLYLKEEALSPLFQAVVEATEEAILNSLFKATTVIGKGGRRGEALPLDRVHAILKKYNRLD